jgi:hypothetical protein
MTYAEERREDERLRVERMEFAVELKQMAEDDPRRPQAIECLKENTLHFRENHFKKAEDCCSVPECIEPGTVSAAGKPWCPVHAESLKASA